MQSMWKYYICLIIWCVILTPISATAIITATFPDNYSILFVVPGDNTEDIVLIIANAMTRIPAPGMFLTINNFALNGAWDFFYDGLSISQNQEYPILGYRIANTAWFRVLFDGKILTVINNNTDFKYTFWWIQSWRYTKAPYAIFYESLLTNVYWGKTDEVENIYIQEDKKNDIHTQR